MQRVHYFQRGSKLEDVATNNALLLLSRIQHLDPRMFQQVLRQLLATEELLVGAELSQQVTTAHGVLDGVIRQRSFQVVVETKWHAKSDAPKLAKHLDAFAVATSDLQVLLLLGRQEPVDLPAVRAELAKFNGVHAKNAALAWTTFAHLAETCRDVVPEHEREIVELIDDFEDFCAGQGLLASSDADLLVVGCSRSLEDNLRFGVYYDLKRPHRAAKFIGFYHGKSVRAIGRIDKIVKADLHDGSFESPSAAALTSDEELRIRAAMESAPRHGWDVRRDHYFILANDLEETSFRKVSKYPLWNWRYLDLREALGLPKSERLPELRAIAAGLRSASW